MGLVGVYFLPRVSQFTAILELEGDNFQCMLVYVSSMRVYARPRHTAQLSW